MNNTTPKNHLTRFSMDSTGFQQLFALFRKILLFFSFLCFYAQILRRHAKNPAQMDCSISNRIQREF
jgi:hypothetical protein